MLAGRRISRQRILKELNSIEARIKRLAEVGPGEFAEDVRDDAWALMMRMAKSGAFWREPGLFLLTSRYSVVCELGASDWRRATIAGMAFSMGVSGICMGRTNMTPEEFSSVAAEIGRMPDATAYAAHRSGFTSLAPMMIETDTSIRVGERMQIRALEALADEPGRLESVGRDLIGRLEKARTNLAFSKRKLPDDQLMALLSGMLTEDVVATLRDESSLPGSGYAFSNAGALPFLAAAIAERVVVYLVSGPHGGAAIRVGAAESGSCDSVELPEFSVFGVQELIGAISAASRYKKVRAVQLREVLEQVGAAVWRPVLDTWPELSADRLALIPVGDAALLPLFTAIVDGVPAGSLFDLVVVPSARGLVLAAGRPVPSREASIVLADPAYGHSLLPPIELTVPEVEAIAAIHGVEPLLSFKGWCRRGLTAVGLGSTSEG